MGEIAFSSFQNHYFVFPQIPSFPLAYIVNIDWSLVNEPPANMHFLL